MVDEVQYLQELIDTHKRRLHVLKNQVAAEGEYRAPAEKITEIASIEKQISDLEQTKRRKIRNADNGEFFSAEQVDEISSRHAEIAEMEKSLALMEGIIKILKESFYRGSQDRTTKIYSVVLGISTILPVANWVAKVLTAKPDKFRQQATFSSLLISAYGALLFYAWRKLQELYIGVEGLDKMFLKQNEVLQDKKRELEKIYKIPRDR